MVDHSRIATDDDFDSMLGEIIMLAQYLGESHRIARQRAKGDPRRTILDGPLNVKDAYPARSMPESEIHGSRTSDPTADYVVGLAEHHWQTPVDPATVSVNNMNREVLDARNRLRGATDSMRKALPTTIPDPVREECITCWVSKSVATRYGKNPRGWVAADSRCKSCSDRLARLGGPTAIKVPGR